MSEETTEKQVFNEAEAAKELQLRSARALRQFRYKRLTRGEHYAKICGQVRYSREHIRRILHIDDRQEAQHGR